MCEQCTRRVFLGTGVAAGGLVLSGAAWTHAWTSDAPPKPQIKSRICVIYTGPVGPEDRGWNTDPKQLAAMKASLADAEKKLGNVELLIGESNSVEQTATLLSNAGPGVPVLAINLSCFSLTRVVKPILDENRPTIVFSLPASGHDWMYPHRWQRQGHPVTLFPSSDYGELERAIRLLRVVPMMQQTRILLFPPARGTAPAAVARRSQEAVGSGCRGGGREDVQRLDRVRPGRRGEG